MPHLTDWLLLIELCGLVFVTMRAISWIRAHAGPSISRIFVPNTWGVHQCLVVADLGLASLLLPIRCGKNNMAGHTD